MSAASNAYIGSQFRNEGGQRAEYIRRPSGVLSFKFRNAVAVDNYAD